METLTPTLLNKLTSSIKSEKSSIVKRIFSNLEKQIIEHLINKNIKAETCVEAEFVIKEIPSGGLKIKQPGSYTLANDITWSPPTDGFFNAAIVIDCDNVILDCKHHTITATESNNHSTFGVYIHHSQNVTVKNGKVKDMGLNGICALSTKELTIRDMIVEGLTYPNFDFLPSAIAVLNSHSFSVDNCHVKDVTVTAKLAGGILAIASKNGKLSNCTVDRLTNNDGVACAFPYFFCEGIDTNSCTATRLTTHYNYNPASTIGHTCIGFMPTDCENVNFIDCTAEHIHGCCDDCHGISLFRVKQSFVSNFTATNVHDGLTPFKTGAKATGVEVYGDNITIQSSTVKYITAIVPQDKQSTGFSACGTNIVFDSCTATDVIVYNADGKPDTSHGYGTGFGWAPDPRKEFVKPSKKVTYKDCLAINCQLGFDTWNHQYSTWINPKVRATKMIYLIEQKGAERVYSMNFCSEQPHSNPNSPTKYYIIENTVENNCYPENWLANLKPKTPCAYSSETNTPFSKSAEGLADWLSTPHIDYNMASLDFYGHLIDEDDQVIGFSSMIQQQFGLPHSMPYLAEFSIGADSTDGIVVAPFLIEKNDVTFTSNPYSETANLNLGIKDEKIKIELVSGTMGQPNAKYKLTGNAIAFDLDTWKYEVELVDTMGAISVGYGPSSFLPQWIDRKQHKVITETYHGNVKAYLEGENDAMSGQGSYYYSLPLLQVTRFSITKNGKTFSKGAKGYLWVDYVTQSFSEASFPILKNKAKWQFLAVQLLPEINQGFSGALMFSKVEVPVPESSDYSILPTARFYRPYGKKQPNSALESVHDYNFDDIEFSTSYTMSKDGESKYPTGFQLQLTNPDKSVYFDLKGEAVRNNQEVKLVKKYEGVYKVTGNITFEPDGYEIKDAFLGYAWGEIH